MHSDNHKVQTQKHKDKNLMLPTIDIHTHAFSPRIAARVLEQLSDTYRISPNGTGLVDDLLHQLDQAGIDNAVVHSAATRAAQVMPANNWAIQVEKMDSRLIAFGTVHPDYKDWESELDRLQSYGIRGIKLHADFQGFDLADTRLNPIFAALEHRFVVMLHVGDNQPPDVCPSSPHKVARIKRCFPGLDLIAAHLGGYCHWPYVVEQYRNLDIYIDTSSSLDVISQTDLENIFNSIPGERICFGSDYPLYRPVDTIQKLRSRLDLSAAQIEQLLTNGNRLFEDRNA